MGSLPVAGVEVTRPRPGFYRRRGKRMLDLALALLGAPVVVLPAALSALAVLVFSGRPVLFRQARVGRHGRCFEILKFRTMRTDGPREGSTVTVSGDSRLTSVGRVLRRWKLDELPQLWNVLRGDMSFVGPRPDVPGFADRLQGEDRVILDILPGITGPATLAFRDEERILAAAADPEGYNAEVVYPAKVALNRKYARDLSLIEDLRVLTATLRALFRSTEAPER